MAEKPKHGEFNPFVLGGIVSLGISTTVATPDYNRQLDLSNTSKLFKFVGGGGAYLGYRFSQLFGLFGGLSVRGKGVAFESEVSGYKVKLKHNVVYLEIPLGIRLNINNFKIGGFTTLDFALAGSAKREAADSETKQTWKDDDWAHHRRVNVGGMIYFGYAIPVGPVAIVPGLDWSMHFINEFKNQDELDKTAIRYMNIMFNVAVEYGLGR